MDNIPEIARLLQSDERYLNLLMSELESYFQKIHTWDQWIYIFEIHVYNLEARIKITQKHRKPNLEYFESNNIQSIYVARLFEEKSQIDKFITKFFFTT